MGSRAVKKTRLGDLLLEKHLISKEQLEEAISSQAITHKQLGEILIERKLVSKWQVRQMLKLQRHLRSAVLTSVLSIAPLALVGCGGGGGASTASIAPPAQQQPVNSRSASLSWNLPSQRADGSDLELYEIDSFRIYHTTEDGSVETMYEVNGDVTAYNLDNLANGKHIFAVSVVDSNGLESELSESVSKTIL